MLKLENSIRGLSFSRVAFDLTIQANKKFLDLGVCKKMDVYIRLIIDIYIQINCI